MYSTMNTALSQFDRATTVAQGYQFYRITNVKLKVKSPYDTYINMGATGTGAYQKPYFYYMLDKSASIPPTITLEGLKQMGAKPRVFDEKGLTVSWKPSVLELVAPALPLTTGIPAKYKLSPWLSTAAAPMTTWLPSGVDHLGIYWGAFASLAGVADPIRFDVELEVQFQFKGPLITTAAGVTAATPTQLAEINQSVDGIVGGPDGI